MALPQDGQNANGLTKVTEIPKGKELIFIDPTTNEGGIITLEDLTTQILKNLTSQTFALDQGNMTLLAALNQLNSNTWVSVGTYDIPANDTDISIQIPSNAKEILLFVGSKNEQQVYGGKSYILCPTPMNIVYEKELFSASGNSIGTGFYAYYNNNVLLMKCKTSSTVLAQVYTK